MWFFVLVIFALLNIVLVYTTQAYAAQYRKALKELRARELPAAVIVDGDEHVHMWGKWEDDIVIRKFIDDGSTERLIIQKRYCTMCNFKESVEVRSR